MLGLDLEVTGDGESFSRAEKENSWRLQNNTLSLFHFNCRQMKSREIIVNKSGSALNNDPINVNGSFDRDKKIKSISKEWIVYNLG